MATKKTTASKATAKETPAKKTAAKVAVDKETDAATTLAATGAAKKTASGKTASKKAAAKKTTPKKAAAKKASTAKPTAKAAATEKASATKSSTSKSSAAKSSTKSAEKPAAKTTAAKKTAAKKAGAKKDAAKSGATNAAASKTALSNQDELVSEIASEGASESALANEVVSEAASAPVGDAASEAALANEAAAAPASEAASEPTPEPAPSPESESPDAPAAQTSEFADLPGVLIAAAECAPLVKVGGLADIVGSLPKYLKKLGVDARVILPFHRQIKERYGTQTQHLADFQASLGWRSQYVGLEKLELDGITYYFIDNEFYFGADVYCGGEFEGEQYAFFTRAVMDSIPLLDYDVRILHCNDWHTAMMPLLAKTQYQGGMQSGLRTVLTIHNLHFQGQFSHEFDRDLLRVDDSLATPQFIEHYGCDNMLKAGIVFADKVNTVSPTYAQEICEPYLGESLDGVLRSRGDDLWGILNGIDNEEWNPQTDKNLPTRFSLKSIWRKPKMREELLQELGLEPAGENTVVISMVSRLTPQKGIDLLFPVLDELLGEDVRMIVLGSGYHEYEDILRDAEARHKGRLCSYIGYNAELSHRIYAGSDLFLMPSLFEPCGVSQMISMRYGTLPVVRETGGLWDTVVPYNEYTGEGNGFSFANYNAHEMLETIRYALSVWRDEIARKRLIKQAMESDFGFERCARTYAELYRSL